jgi:hypothetical protein
MLDLGDIQATVLRYRPEPYYGTHVMLHVDDARAGREFLARLAPHVDSAAGWWQVGRSWISVAISYAGLVALGVPRDSLQSFPEALSELRARRDAGDLLSARAEAESVAPFWKAPGPELLEPALATAARLEDPGIALLLLRPFAVEWLTPAHAGELAVLATRYGEAWHRNLLDAWFGSRRTWRYNTGDVFRNGWAGALPGLTAALRDADAAATAGWLLAASWGWLDDDIRLRSTPIWPGVRWPSWPVSGCRRLCAAAWQESRVAATAGAKAPSEVASLLGRCSELKPQLIESACSPRFSGRQGA